MFNSLITINKEAYQVKFGMISLINISKLLYIKDEKELLKQKFCISEVAKLDNTSLTFEQKEELFDKYINDSIGGQMIEEVLSEAISLALGEYQKIDERLYKELYSKAVGEIGLSIKEFNSMTPAEIDLAYCGYLKREELIANCNLIAIRKSKDSKADLISLLGGNGYNHISETERKEVLNTLNL